MILIEIKKEACYIKGTAKPHRKKNSKKFKLIKCIWLLDQQLRAFQLNNGTLISDKPLIFKKIRNNFVFHTDVITITGHEFTRNYSQIGGPNHYQADISLLIKILLST